MFTGSQSQYQALRLAGHVELYFHGWRSTLAELFSHGWNCYINGSMFDYRSMLLLENKELRLAAIIPDVMMMDRLPSHRLAVSYTGACKDIHIHMHGGALEIQPVSLDFSAPLTSCESVFRIADILRPFSPEQLLVPEEDEKTVDDLLGHILLKQTNLRQQIAERRVKESLIERPTAQIVKLFAA